MVLYTYLFMSKWQVYEPDYSKPHSITIFDHENIHYKKLKNTWYICGNWKEKVRLINDDRKTIVQSISNWKVLKNIETNFPYKIRDE